MNKNVLLFDVETTGLNPRKSFILSIGAILAKVDYDKATNIENKEFYGLINWKLINKNFEIPEDTVKVHGLTQELLDKEGKHPVHLFGSFYDFLKENPIDIFCAFNLGYDQNMFRSNLLFMEDYLEKHINEYDIEFYEKIKNLSNMFKKAYIDEKVNKSIFFDSMTYDKIFHFEVDGVKVKHGLDAVGRRYNIPSDPNAHNAIADTRRLYEIFKIQLKEISEMENVEIDAFMERRIIVKYDRENDYYRRINPRNIPLDYLGFNMTKVEF